MALVDTSVWIDVFRDKTEGKRQALLRELADSPVTLTRFTQLELLQGALNEKEWDLLRPYLDAQDYVEMAVSTWEDAARIYFDLRRRSRTVRSAIDCCIAQLALEHNLLLLHRDHDFEAISEVRPLQQKWMSW